MLIGMTIYEFDDFRFDPTDGRLSSRTGSAEAHLRPQAGKLLVQLLAQPRTVIERDRLIGEVWGRETVVDFESGLAALLREIRQALQSLGGDPTLIETVPRRGYRLRADVRRIENARRRDAGNRTARLTTIAAIASLVLVAVALATVAWWRHAPTPEAGPDAPHQLAILPLERFGNPDQPPARADILLADGILAALWRADLENLELIGRAGMRPYAGREDVVSAVAADLGVDLLIEGSIRLTADAWQVDVRLMQVPPGRVVWSQSLAGDDPALPTGAVAAELVDRLAGDWAGLRIELIR